MKTSLITIIERYVAFIRWLLNDSIWARKRLSVIVILSAMLGIGFQLGVFALIILYARHFSSGEVIHVSGAIFDPRSSIELLVACSVIVVVFLLLSASFIYYSRRTILRTARQYEEYCAKRVFKLLLESDGPLVVPRGSGESFLLRLVRADARFAGRVLRRILSMVIPFGILAVTVSVLVYLDPVLSVFIAIMGVVLLVYQYHISRHAATHSMRFERLAPSAGSEYRGLIEQSKHLPIPVDGGKVIEALFAKGPVREQLDAYVGRLRSVEASRFASGIFMALVVGVILLVMGMGIIREGSGWGRLLIYVVALRFAMMGVQGVFSSITAINRFYPQVRRYMTFVQIYSARDAAHHSPRNEYTIALDKNVMALPASLDAIVLARGSRVALVSPLDINRYTMTALCEGLLGADQDAVLGALHSVRYASMGFGRPAASLRQMLTLSGDAGWDDIQTWFPDEDYWKSVRALLPNDLDSPISQSNWNRLDPGVKFTLSLLSAHSHDCAWLFIEAEGLQCLGEEISKFCLGRFPNSIVVIVYKSEHAKPGIYGEQSVIVADEESLLGMGSVDWFYTVSDDVDNRLASVRLRKLVSEDAAEGSHIEE